MINVKSRNVKSRRDNSILMAALMVLGLLSIAAAWFFQSVVGLIPCTLCLQQRWPYYIGLPLTIIAFCLSRTGWTGWTGWISAIMLLVTMIFLAGAMMGGYHAGMEWGWWPGPDQCGMAADSATQRDAATLSQRIAQSTITPCGEASWRLFGISMAGYNTLISSTLSFIALSIVRRTLLSSID